MMSVAPKKKATPMMSVAPKKPIVSSKPIAPVKGVSSVKLPISQWPKVGAGSVAGFQWPFAKPKPTPTFKWAGGWSGGAWAGDKQAVGGMSKAENLMSTKAWPMPWYIKKWPEKMMSTPENMMSTTEWPKPWYITKPTEQMMSPNPVAPTATQKLPAGMTSSQYTDYYNSQTTTDQATLDQQGYWAEAWETAPTPEWESAPTPQVTDVNWQPTTSDAEVTPPDYVGQDIALSQAEYMQKSKEEEEFARNQRSIQTQVDTLTGEMSQLQSSETIRKTQDDLEIGCIIF